MIVIKKLVAALLAIVFIVSLFTMGGCTKYASQDDLEQLNEYKQAAVSAEKELDKVKAERQKLEEELADRKKELKEAKEEFVKVKIISWQP